MQLTRIMPSEGYTASQQVLQCIRCGVAMIEGRLKVPLSFGRNNDYSRRHRSSPIRPEAPILTFGIIGCNIEISWLGWLGGAADNDNGTATMVYSVGQVGRIH